ncbi:hypothetical protein NLJ89_g9158 [Agrocybe chaxingu]|uniref:Uncharacterized protein n=1 Tax=Agrocybe chaxingu TaxID=84603 RepID=A0A9W8MTE2_9AGAR|nr:hypothetical protein NLJ89_g9158 [Agrocybe chaxingu]
MDKAAQGDVDDRRNGSTSWFSPEDAMTDNNNPVVDETSGNNGTSAATTPTTILPMHDGNDNNSGTNPCILITPGGNQEFFVDAISPRINDCVVNSADTTPRGADTPGGGIRIGNASIGLLLENCVFRTYTGDGQGFDLQALLNQKSLLPRGNSG